MEAWKYDFKDPWVVEDVRDLRSVLRDGQCSLWCMYCGRAPVREDPQSKSSRRCVQCYLCNRREDDDRWDEDGYDFLYLWTGGERTPFLEL